MDSFLTKTYRFTTGDVHSRPEPCEAHFGEAEVLMHRSDLLTISDFLVHLFTFILDTTGIRY